MGDAGPSVLVVEDSATTRQIVEMTLRNAGFRPTGVISVQEALACMRSEAPDLVITDLRLPDSTGFKLCRFVRDEPSLKGVKVILMSGVPAAQASEEGFPGAYDGFMEKPFTLRRLLEAVREALKPPVRAMVAYRPRKGDRITITTDLAAHDVAEHCVEVHEIVEVDDAGRPAKAHVQYPERWTEEKGERRAHVLEGQRATLSEAQGRVKVHGLRVKALEEWPKSLVPGICALLPGREMQTGETAQAPGVRMTLTGAADGVLTVALEFELPVRVASRPARFAGKGEASMDAERGWIRTATFEGTLDANGKRVAATLTVSGAIGTYA